MAEPSQWCTSLPRLDSCWAAIHWGDPYPGVGSVLASRTLPFPFLELPRVNILQAAQASLPYALGLHHGCLGPA